MKRIKVLLDFIEFSVTRKITFYRNVLAKMREGSTVFSNPDESLDKAATLLEALETNYIAALGGGHATTVAMRASEVAADEVFRVLAAYVDRTAKGDEIVISISGFNASRQPAAFQKPDLSAFNGSNSGSVKLVAKAVSKAGAYIWQYAKDRIPTDESEWISAGFTTQANNELNGLSVACRYYFRVAAITSTGTTDFTTPILKIVE